MNTQGQETSNSFDSLVIVSPMCFGDEDKNQDRACYYSAAGVACVCDGVTSSPRAAEAAQLAAEFSPGLFGGDIRERLASLAGILVAHRLDAQRAPIRIPAGTLPAIEPALREAARQRLKSAYQTTLVAAWLTPADCCVAAQIVVCGDSAMFVFSPQGELLTSTLSWEGRHGICPGDSSTEDSGSVMQPGVEVLVKSIGTAAEWPSLAARAGLQSAHAQRWIVCIPLDRSCDRPPIPDTTGIERPQRSRTDEILLVPMYLVGGNTIGEGQQYFRLRYSKLIRSLSEPAERPVLNARGSVTAVLPDHFESGRWFFHQDRFPRHAHFVLASDGFYRAFDDADQLWSWLQNNEQRIEGPLQAEAMRDLHSRLHERCGDDDMSLVWVRPAERDRSERHTTQIDPTQTGGGDAC
jgi:serine/threonine protein phosphatase PrpC